MNHIRIEWGFGVQFDKDHHGITRDQLHDSLRVIKKEAGQLFSAYTLVPTCGAWTNGNGKLVTEDGYTLFTVVDQPECYYRDILPKVEQLAAVIRTQLNQEAVAVTANPVHFKLM